MVVFKKNFNIILLTLILIFLIAFIGSGIYYMLAVTDNKLYDNNNKYIDNTLTGDELISNDNIQDNYKINAYTSEWVIISMNFIKIILKVILILSIPLLIYYFFIDKNNGVLYYINKIINK